MCIRDRSYEIARAHIRDLPRVKPFWKAMLKSYVRLMGDDLPVRDPGEAWARRHDEYHKWLNEGGGMIFLATDTETDQIAGYAAVKFTASVSYTHLDVYKRQPWNPAATR